MRLIIEKTPYNGRRYTATDLRNELTLHRSSVRTCGLIVGAYIPVLSITRAHAAKWLWECRAIARKDNQ